MIELQEIKKTYRTTSIEVKALRGVSLKVEPSDIFGIVGNSGAGKSTLIRCINLLERPDSGVVKIGGKDISQYSEKQLMAVRQKIGMIFQHFNLLKSKTVFDNIAFPLRYQQKSKAEIKQKTEELLHIVGLTDKADSYPAQLSGGQKQRVAIARALANDPQILLSDEATSALDPKTTESILELLQKLNRTLGLTIVIITHEMNVVREICNKVAVMEDGRIAEQGGIFDVFSNPQAEVTRHFTSGLFKLDGMYKLLDQIEIRTLIGETGALLHLVFIGEQANEDIITQTVKRFNVSISVIYGSIEIIQGKPIGSLFVTLKGNPLTNRDVLSFLRKSGVRVSILKEGFGTEGEYERAVTEIIS